MSTSSSTSTPSTPLLPRPSLTSIARSTTSSNFTWPRPLPSFTATSSRGSIPHLTPDNLHSHTTISSVHIGLEDFITPPAHQSAIFDIPVSLQKYLAFPEEMKVILGARRANPVPINASWDNKIEIQTVDGRNPLPLEVFVEGLRKLGLREGDVVVSVPDVTEAPGVKRLAKMVERTQRWLKQLLQSEPSCQIYASIPPIPLSRAPALMDDYMDFLSENSSRINGIAIYNIFPDQSILRYLPSEFSSLPIMLDPSPVTPHEILSAIISDGVSMFTAGGMITSMSDLGVALDFRLSPLNEGKGEGKRPLGRDMFNEENEEDMRPLMEGCECFTCTNHHRAYIHHLLKCHEMTAWVLLQLWPPPPPRTSLTDRHNFRVLDTFFKEIGTSIQNSTLLHAAEVFDATYSTEEIIEAGSRGPRVRGHHTSLRREQKKRKLPVATNKGLVGKDMSVMSGGEIIEKEGKRKHWRKLEGVANDEVEEGITDEGMEIFDEEERVEGELLPDGEIEMTDELPTENGQKA